MKCPHCQHDHHTVTETRGDGVDLYRRRCCKACGKHFVTVEKAPADLKMPSALNHTPASRFKPGQKKFQAPDIKVKTKIGKNSTGKDLQKVWG